MMTKLAIKMNNLATNDPCAICGRRTDPSTGPELFTANTWGVVCWQCGEEHAPELLAMLRAYRAFEGVLLYGGCQSDEHCQL